MLRGHLDAVQSLAVLDGGKALVSCGQDGVIKIWGLSQGRERLTLGGKTLRVRSMGLCRGDHNAVEFLCIVRWPGPPPLPKKTTNHRSAFPIEVGPQSCTRRHLSDG